MKLIVKPTSSNLWWGIYGLTEKCGYEDMTIFYEDGKRIGAVCLITKEYLRAHLDELKADPEEIKLTNAVENYLKDHKVRYWFYYDKIGDKDFHEVPYEVAPRNEEGVKPRFIEIWHPDECIGISTIKSAVKEFGKKFLHKEICKVEIENSETFEESVKSFKENKKFFCPNSPTKNSFNEELINELSNYWGISKEQVLTKLKKGIE